MSNRDLIRSWLNKPMKILMSDGRTLVGTFICTDKDCNVILGMCQEFVRDDVTSESRSLGLAMVPGHHIRKIWTDVPVASQDEL